MTTSTESARILTDLRLLARRRRANANRHGHPPWQPRALSAPCNRDRRPGESVIRARDVRSGAIRQVVCWVGTESSRVSRRLGDSVALGQCSTGQKVKRAASRPNWRDLRSFAGMSRRLDSLIALPRHPFKRENERIRRFGLLKAPIRKGTRGG